MKRKIALGILAAIALGFGTILVSKAIHARNDKAAFEHQLALARAEGLATTWQEYAATIPRAAPAENAAPLYRRLMHQSEVSVADKPSEAQIHSDLLLHPGPKSVVAAKSYLARHADTLQIIDEATKLPRCWFDRDWSQGYAVLLPEYAQMKRASHVLLLRASLAAASGDANKALSDADEIFKVSAHAHEEPGTIQHLVGESIYLMGLQHLGTWAMQHPEQPAYLQALRQRFRNFPKPNLHEENSDQLTGLLSLVDQSVTPEGRKQLGIKEEEVGMMNKVAPLLMNQPKAKVQIVEEERELWAAQSLPARTRQVKAAEVQRRISASLMAFPLAAQCYSMFGFDGTEPMRDLWYEGRIQEYTALVRALSQQTIPKSIRTSDLLSPYNGKPIDYRFDGKQIVIGVNANGFNNGPASLKIPPDPPSTRR